MGLDLQFLWAFFGGILWSFQSLFTYIGLIIGVGPFIFLLFPKLEGRMKDLKEKSEGLRKHALTIIMAFMLVSSIITAYQLYENKQAHFATPEALMPAYLHDMNIRIADLAIENTYIRNKTFERCELWGPAVVILSGNTVVNHLSMGIPSLENMNDIFVDTTNPRILGAVTFDNCVFRSCGLHLVGFIGDNDTMVMLKQAFKDKIYMKDK
jgi:hypothetical protein